MDQKFKSSRQHDEILNDPSSYRRLVGRLLYLTVTRPESTFAVNQLSQHMSAPCKHHLADALRVLRFLKKALGQVFFFPKDSSLQLTTYCDSDWGSCPMTRHFTIGYVVFLGKSLISWKT